jgi:mono/diheme cytochrome c family protein
MNHTIPALALVLSVAAPFVHAQTSAGDRSATQALGRQLLAQSCAVCHLPPTLGAKTHMGVMTIRTEAELAALKARAGL